MAISLLPTGSWAALAIAWGTLALLSASAGLGPFRLSRGAFFALPFMLAALPLIFTRPGDILATFQLGPLTISISGQGIVEFLTIALKSWVSVQVALLLTFTTPFHDLVDGLRKMRMPRVIVSTISFMYRYIAVLSDEAGRMMRARAARSAHVDGSGGGSLVWRMRVVGGMVGSLFLRSYERSERVYAAMQARGFSGEFRHMHGRPLDAADRAVFVAALAAIALFEIAGQLWLPHA
ncbi:MAG: cobalt ECF transporter T component CbiQ [Chloroflexi bacterium]|nr:cobalt ECF transporter T component CbiQ [Chloroflexota bacterium]